MDKPKTSQETPNTLLQRMAVAAIGTLLAAAALGQDTPGDSDTVRRAVHVCASCHGDAGRHAKPGIPNLAGQQRAYTLAQLRDFRNQSRAETGSLAYMWGISALLDDATMVGLADYYAVQAPAAGTPVPAAAAALGKRIFNQGAPERGVRACAGCHGTQAEGASGFPRLAGQRADYLLAQFKVFGTRLRPHGVLMSEEIKGLKPAEMRAVAQYLQSL